MSGSGGPSALSEWGCVKGRTDEPRGSHVVQELGIPRGIYDEKVLNRHRIIVILGKKTNVKFSELLCTTCFMAMVPLTHIHSSHHSTEHLLWALSLFVQDSALLK